MEITVKLNAKVCYTCSIVFAIPQAFEDSRRDDGEGFYCPNGHVLKWPGFDSRAELKEQLDAAHAENNALNNCNVGLRSKLDQQEAMLIEHGLMKAEKETPPPSPPLAPRESKIVDPPQNEEVE